MHVSVVTDDGRRMQLRVKDFPLPPKRAGHIKLPMPFEPHNAAVPTRSRELIRDRGRRGIRRRRELHDRSGLGGKKRAQRGNPLERLAQKHPVAACPDASQHLRALRRVERLERDLANERRQRRNDDASLGRQLDRVLDVLAALGFVDGWTLTAAGDQLARIYHENDLFIADCIGLGLLDDLDTVGARRAWSRSSRSKRARTKSSGWHQAARWPPASPRSRMQPRAPQRARAQEPPSPHTRTRRGSR